MGLVFAPFFGLVLSAVDDHELGSANGLITSVDQLGGAVATAVFSTIFFDRLDANASPFASARLIYRLCAACSS